MSRRRGGERHKNSVVLVSTLRYMRPEPSFAPRTTHHRSCSSCIKKPVFAWMLMAATIVFGLVAAQRIGISQFPDVDFPTINISVILMTSIATMMAAVPAALALGAGSETRQPMAIAVLGGLSVSTLLSLVVVPAFYVVADRNKRWLLGRFWREMEEPPEEKPAQG